MYSIIFNKSELENDLYGRQIDKEVVWKFIKLCNKYNILIKNINNKNFYYIYKKYVDYQILEYENL